MTAALNDTDRLNETAEGYIQRVIAEANQRRWRRAYASNSGEKWSDDLDHFLFWEMLGSGGFGDVFKAFNVEKNKSCAIKLLRVPMSSLEGQVREIRALGTLNHPNVVELHCAALIQRTILMLVMPLLWSLDDLVEELKMAKITNDGIVSEKCTRQLVKQLLKGLVYVHSKGFVHRDLKVANLLIDGHGTLKIADFGMCCQFDPHENELGALKTPCGTELYMAPEVYFQYGKMQTADYDIRCDSWAVGVIAMELRTGQLPFGDIMHMSNHENMLRRTMREHMINSPHFDWGIVYPGVNIHLQNMLSAQAKDFIFQAMNGVPDHRPTCAELLEHQWVNVEDRKADRRIRDELLKSSVLDTVEVMERYGNMDSMALFDSVSAKIHPRNVIVTIMVRPAGSGYRRRVTRFLVDIEGQVTPYYKRTVEKLARCKVLPFSRKRFINGRDFIRLSMKVVSCCQRFRRSRHVKAAYELFALSGEPRPANYDTCEGLALVLVNKSLRKSELIVKSQIAGVELRADRLSRDQLREARQQALDQLERRSEASTVASMLTTDTESSLSSGAADFTVDSVSADSEPNAAADRSIAGVIKKRRRGLMRVLFNAPFRGFWKKKRAQFNHSNRGS